jgi:hypothetical protein
MTEISIGSGSIALSLTEYALRVWLLVTGLLVAGHYHCMANYIKKAPHFVRALALPAITGAGVGMAVCALWGSTLQGAMFGAAAAGLMAIINLAAWGAGAYVSEQLERAAEVREQINRDGWAFVREFDQLTEHAKMAEEAEQQQSQAWFR